MDSGLRRRAVRAWGEFVGPEAGPIDNTITAVLAALGALVAPNVSRRRSLNAGESLLLRAFATDLWGGAWANNTRACTRWYERPGQTDADHLEFAALHVHPIAIAWLDRDEPGRRPLWLWGGVHYGYLMVATVAIRRYARRRRPLGVTLTAGGIALDAVLGPSRTAPWFAPVYYTKLLLGHAAASLWTSGSFRSHPPQPESTPGPFAATCVPPGCDRRGPR